VRGIIGGKVISKIPYNMQKRAEGYSLAFKDTASPDTQFMPTVPAPALVAPDLVDRGAAAGRA